MSDFTEVAVGDHLKLTSGFPFASSQFSDDGFPLIRIRDVLTSQTETYFQGAFPPGYIIKKGDILVGMDGDFHVVKWRGCNALLNQRVLKIDVQTEATIVLDYLFYWLGPFVKKINDITAATTVKHLSTKDLIKARAKFPEVAAQRKIAAILTSVDTAIEKTEALIEKYQHIKAGLMHDLFTRGVLPNGQLRPLRAQAPELYQETTIGWIPKEWSVSILEHACLIIVDCPHSTPTFTQGGVLVARTMHIKNGIFLEDIASRVSEQEYNERNARSVPMPGDVVLTREAPVGEAFVIPRGMRICLGQRVMLIKPKPSVLDSDYLVAQIYSGGLSTRISELTAGTTNPHLNVADVRRLAIAVPNFFEQTLMTMRIKAFNEHVRGQKENLEKLKNQKLGLMQDLLTGKVSVKVDDQVAEFMGG